MSRNRKPALSPLDSALIGGGAALLVIVLLGVAGRSIATAVQQPGPCAVERTFEGHITSEFVAFLGRQDPSTTVCVSLAGGSERAAFEAADTIERLQLRARVYGECTAACVDFLFPAFSRIELFGMPSVMTFGNPAYREAKVAAAGGYGALQPSVAPAQTVALQRHCGAGAARLQALYRRTGADLDALSRLTDLLGFEGLAPRERACPNLTFRQDILSLRLADLVTVYGSKVTGEACADSETCFPRSQRQGAAIGMPDVIRTPAPVIR